MKQSIALLLFLCGTALAQEPFWTGTGTVGGGLIAPVYPTADGTLFTGTAEAGGFRSTDKGITWNRVIPTGQVVCAFLERPGPKLLACTETTIISSTDGGLTWEHLSDFGAAAIAADSAGMLYAANYTGIFSSRDGGVTWKMSFPGGSTFAIYALCSDRQGVMFATHGERLVAGVLRLMPGDTTWVQVYNGTAEGMLVAPDSSLLVGAGGSVIRSTDHGTTWQTLWTLPATETKLSWISALGMAPNGHLFAAAYGQGSYFADCGMFRSTDGGSSWTKLQIDAVGKIFAVMADPGGALLAATEHGLFRSIDDGTTWTLSNAGINNATVKAVMYSARGYLFAGLPAFGVFRSSDNGNSWVQCNTGLSNTQVSFLGGDPAGNIYAGTFNGIFRSTDDGATWGQPAPLAAVGNGPFMLSNSPDGTIHTTTWDGEFRSTDSGESWAKVQHPGGITRGLVCDKDGRLYAGTDWGVYRSSDKGDSWTQLYSGDQVLAIAITAQGKILIAGWNGGVLGSSDNGDHWVSDSAGIGRAMVNGFVESSGVVYAATYWGVYATTNEGESWTQRNDGMEAASYVWSLTLDKKGYLFAATEQGGVFRSRSSTVDVELRTSDRLPGAFALEQNWPNPWNPSTTIGYTVGGIGDRGPGIGNVKLIVYNLLGQEIATLVNESQAPGRYQVRFDAGKLASGMYLYRLLAGNFVETKRMLLIR